MPLKTAINVLKIAQFDENLNTITLNVLLSVAWSDTRIRLESNKPNPRRMYLLKNSNYIMIYECSLRDRHSKGTFLSEDTDTFVITPM